MTDRSYGDAVIDALRDGAFERELADIRAELLAIPETDPEWQAAQERIRRHDELTSAVRALHELDEAGDQS